MMPLPLQQTLATVCVLYERVGTESSGADGRSGSCSPSIGRRASQQGDCRPIDGLTHKLRCNSTLTFHPSPPASIFTLILRLICLTLKSVAGQRNTGRKLPYNIQCNEFIHIASHIFFICNFLISISTATSFQCKNTFTTQLLAIQ